MKQSVTKHWQVRAQPKKPFNDPRLAIAKHIGWIRPLASVTDQGTPEPDNYNRAVFTDQPVECKFIQDQVIYYDSVRRGWFNVALVEPEQLAEYSAWTDRLNWRAKWQHDAATPIRTRVVG